MPCAAYQDPRLAVVYDPLNEGDWDHNFYDTIAGTGRLRILDVGSGTGRFACRLADAGHAVTGVEPAAGMIAIARARSDAVTWIEAGAEDFGTDRRFDLATMTGHVFQVFLDDEQVRAVFANVHRHLAPGGRLAFESRNPQAREWESWTPEETAEDVDVPGIGTVLVHYAVTDVDGEHVAFDTHFTFPDGDVVVAPQTLRFMPKAHLARLLAETGFSRVDWYGDFDGAPWTPESPEIIAVAHR